jgi:hypothetical protein
MFVVILAHYHTLQLIITLVDFHYSLICQGNFIKNEYYTVVVVHLSLLITQDKPRKALISLKE